MAIDDILSDLIDTAYAAAIDDDLWEEWSARTIISFGGSGGTFSVLDTKTNTIRKLIPLGWNKFETDYFGEWSQSDPLIPTVMRARRACTFMDTDHVNLHDEATAAYMKWQREVAGLDHHMAAAVPLAGSGLRAGLSIHRSVADGHTPSGEYGKLKAILPQVARALQLGFRHNEMLLNSFWDGLSALLSKKAAVLLDEGGRVLRKTSQADRVFANGDGLIALHGTLTAAWPADDNSLQNVIGKVVGASASSGALRIHRRSGRSPYIVVAYPLVRSKRVLAPAEAAALITIVDPASLENGSPQMLYQQAFNLTAREAEVAHLLMAGHSVESAAAALLISMPTARIHMRRIFHKTGTAGQSSLARLLAQIQGPAL